MFLQEIRSEGLAHLSYLLGDAGEAAVIDPRRDCDVYLEAAGREGARITHVIETHRNEDYLTGSREIAARTGAQIHVGAAGERGYGAPASDGDTYSMGDMRLRVLETPGHTLESISIALSDTGFGEEPVAVFTGDSLFIGDVGRTDFYPDRKEEVAGLLYDSIFGKLLPLGDHVILYPAHGSGSICGSGMASREFSTLGYERLTNPALQMDRDAFIRHKVNEHHYKPPYFKYMESSNQHGIAPLLEHLPRPRPLQPDAFEQAMESGLAVVDIRSPEAFAGAFIPGSLAIPLNMLPGFAGWYLAFDQEIGLVTDYEAYDDVETAVRYLARLGYDRITCFLAGGLHAWESSGRCYGRIPAVHVHELEERMRRNAAFTLLDVRSQEEVEKQRLQGAIHIYVGELPERLDEVPREGTITTFCGSGRRAIIAASILKQNGFKNVENSLGSMSACAAVGCPVLTGAVT